MTPKEAWRLASTIHNTRILRGLTAKEVALQAGVDPGTVTRIEQAKIASPRADSLIAIAHVLDIPVSDLFTVAAWIPARELPSLMPYMRAKYAALPDSAYQEISDFLDSIRERYGTQGPAPGEDEYQ